MHAFIDAFVIGEGEEVIHDIINVIISMRGIGKPDHQEEIATSLGFDPERAQGVTPKSTATQPPAARNDILKALAKIPGVYVPKYYKVHYMDNGTVARVEIL